LDPIYGEFKSSRSFGQGSSWQWDMDGPDGV
jgi:hypothetical protein